MFNDESDTIRLHAILAITNLSSKWPLYISENLLPSLLLILSHNDTIIQNASFKMMAHLLFTSASILQSTVDTLTSRLNHCNEESVMMCIAKVGTNHAHFIDEAFISQLLRLDSRFLAKEIRLDDNIRN
jgi:hypothetical protein